MFTVTLVTLGNYAPVNFTTALVLVNVIVKKLYQLQVVWNGEIMRGMDNGHYIRRRFGKCSQR
jgi:hypothetical protein